VETCLRFEQLEARTLLAVAAFHVNLYEDVGGEPGALITTDAVDINDTFFVEIMARELDPARAGLGGVALDIAWDPAVLEEIDGTPFDLGAVITPHLPFFRDGKLDNDTGTIDNLSGYASLSSSVGRPIGNLRAERFALLHFRAVGAADATPFVMRQGRSGIATVPVSSLSSANLDFEAQTITVLAQGQTSQIGPEMNGQTTEGTPPPEEQPPQETEGGSAGDANTGNSEGPQLTLTAMSGSLAEGIQFTTRIPGTDGDPSVSCLVRPAFPDDTQFIEVGNVGSSPLVIQEIQINVPDVKLDVTLSADSDDDLTLEPGQVQRFQLTYAPTVPNPWDTSTQSFDVPDGLVILSNAENTPRMEIGLSGASTYDADLTYDGQVDAADVVVFADYYGVYAEDADSGRFADLDGDGSVDLGDLAYIAFYYDLSRPGFGTTLQEVAAATAGADQTAAEDGEPLPIEYLNTTSVTSEPAPSVHYLRVTDTAISETIRGDLASTILSDDDEEPLTTVAVSRFEQQDQTDEGEDSELLPYVSPFDLNASYAKAA
jgi:hypothetical protein